jgi:predicted NBD/HSP70 family sugar kinase
VHERKSAQPGVLRSMNLRASFDQVHAHGPIGAQELVRLTGLSRPTVGEVITQLLELGLIQRVGRTSGLRGPTAQLYDVNPRAGWVLGLDIGRQWLRSALADLTGTVVARSQSRTGESTTSGLIAQVREAAVGLTAEAGIGLTDLHQIVVGTPGVIRPGEDHFSLAPNLLGWESASVISEIRRTLLEPVTFENDVNLAAVGEHAAGVGRGVDDLVYVSVGTGVGMGVILDGELRRGAAGLAGEIGYLALNLDNAPSARVEALSARVAVWGTGAFEAQAGSHGIVALAAERGVVADSSADVFAAARAGDPAAAEVVIIEGRRLAHAIAAIAAVLDPQLVVLGGGVGAGSGDLLIGPIAEALPAISPFSPRLAISALGAEAVLTGAIATGLSRALDEIIERAGGGAPLAVTSRGAAGAVDGSAAGSARRSRQTIEVSL